MKKFILILSGILFMISCAADEKTLQTESIIPITTIVNETLAENEIEEPLKKVPLHDLTLLEQGEENNLWQFKIHGNGYLKESVLTYKVFAINMLLPANWKKVPGELWTLWDGNPMYFPFDFIDEKDSYIRLMAPNAYNNIIEEYWVASSDKLDLIKQTFLPTPEKGLDNTVLFDYIIVNDKKWLIRYASDIENENKYFCNIVTIYEDEYRINLVFFLGEVDVNVESTKEFVRSILEGFEIVRVEEVESVD